MRVCVEGVEYTGSGTEIMEQLRQINVPNGRIPDAESYIRYLCANFTRATGLPCVISESVPVEDQARAMIARLAEVGGLLLLDDS
ncbi:MAG: hypothetical protein IJT94_07340 [Oscillibacter sp.]|nr:hypothetical protein [Oscillibacter sp.]